MKRNSLFVLLLFYIFSTANASFIRLDTTFSAKAEGDNLKIDLASTNKGDESAFNVQAEVKIGGKYLIAEKRPELRIGDKYSFFDSIPLPGAKPGNYPAILTMHYADANSYPFSALNCQTFSVKGASISPLVGQAKNISITDRGKIKFTVKNPESREIKGTFFLAAPKEITVDNNPVFTTCSAKSQKNTFFEITNFSALAGSTYRLFGILEFDLDGKHYTNIIPVTVKINSGGGFLGLSYFSLAIILAGLIIIFLFFQFYKNDAKKNNR